MASPPYTGGAIRYALEGAEITVLGQPRVPGSLGNDRRRAVISSNWRQRRSHSEWSKEWGGPRGPTAALFPAVIVRRGA